MVTEQRLKEYRQGLEQQLQALQAQIKMVEGAILFCDQLLNGAAAPESAQDVQKEPAPQG